MLRIANIVMPGGIARQWYHPVDWPNFCWQVSLAKSWGATHISTPCWGQHAPDADLEEVATAIKIIEEEFGLKTILWPDKWLALDHGLWPKLNLFLSRFAQDGRIVDIAREADRVPLSLSLVVERLWLLKSFLLSHGVITPNQIMLGGGTPHGTAMLDRVGPKYLTHTLYHSIIQGHYQPDHPDGGDLFTSELYGIKKQMHPDHRLVIVEIGWSDYVPGVGRLPHLIANTLRDGITASRVVGVAGVGVWCVSDQKDNPDMIEAAHGVIDMDTAAPKPGVLESLLTWK